MTFDHSKYVIEIWSKEKSKFGFIARDDYLAKLLTRLEGHEYLQKNLIEEL